MLMWLSQRRLRQPQSALRRLLALSLVVLLYSSTSDAFAAAFSSKAKSLFQNPDLFAALDTSVIQGRPMRIVLAGPTGAGKTLFCEFLRLALRSSDMADPTHANAEFLRSYHLELGQETSFLSGTRKVTKYTETLRGGASVEIYDTPGLAGDIEHIVEIDTQLESLDYVDAVLLVFHGDDQQRSDDEMKKVLAQLSTVFQPAVYPNIVLLFSHLTYRSRLPQMMIDPYLEAEFNFTSEEVKSRRFCMDNPLNALAKLFDPSAVRETIASVLQRGSRVHRQRYNNGVKELNRLLQYFAPSKSVPRCTNPNFGSFSLNKELFEYLGQVLAQGENDALPTNGAVPAFDLELASNKALLEDKIASRGRIVLENTLKVTYNLKALLCLASGGAIATAGMMVGGLHYSAVFVMAACDLFNSNKEQTTLENTKAQFQLINEKLDYLTNEIEDVVHEQMKKAVFLEIKARSGKILKLADELATACRTGSPSGSFFDALAAECSHFSPGHSLEILRLYHIPDSEQDSLLKRANYDPRKIENVRRVLSLLLNDLLHAAGISRSICGMSRAGAHSPSQLLKRLFRDSIQTPAQQSMVNEARLILNEFHAKIIPKLREGALPYGLPVAMRSALENHSELSTIKDSLHELVANWYRPLFCEDKLEFFVAVYRRAEKASWFASGPRPHEQYSFTKPDKQFRGRACAVKLDDVNGKCAIVMWNTCAPKFTASTFRDCLEVDDLFISWDSCLRQSENLFAAQEYCSFQLVHSGHGWLGRSTCPERFVCETISLTNYVKEAGFRIARIGEEKFDLVIG